MTQSDFDFVGRLVENRFADAPVRLRVLALLPGWYSILLAGAVLAGAAVLLSYQPPAAAAGAEYKPPQRPLRVDPPHIATDKAVGRASYPRDFKLFDLNLVPLREQLFSVANSNRSTVIVLPNADGQ